MDLIICKAETYEFADDYLTTRYVPVNDGVSRVIFNRDQLEAYSRELLRIVDMDGDWLECDLKADLDNVFKEPDNEK